MKVTLEMPDTAVALNIVVLFQNDGGDVGDTGDFAGAEPALAGDDLVTTFSVLTDKDGLQ